MVAITPNALFQADCVDLMTRLDTESIDLIYLDPPLPRQVGNKLSLAKPTNEDWRGQLYLISKVCQHACRLLKPTGVLFFHAQPISAFRIRLILNQTFGESNFRNEIVWKYGSASMLHSRTTGREHDTILHFSKSYESTDNAIFGTHSEVARPSADAPQRSPYALADLTAASRDEKLRFEWQGVVPPEGRTWRYPAETLEQLEAEGRIFLSGKGQIPKLKIFLNGNVRSEAETIWTDIPLLSLSSEENTRYPTQKPLGLMERVVCKGSDEGQILLDPFCGSGTTIIAAERLGRRWISCDTSETAIEVTINRLSTEFGQSRCTMFTRGDTESLAQFPIRSALFRRVAVGIEELVSNIEPEFILNQQVEVEETRHCEFKEVRSASGVVDTIANTADEYAVAFLNGEGGRIYWGIRDKDRAVMGVRLSYHERDNLRRVVTSKLNEIEPRVDPSKFRIQLHQVWDEQGQEIQDTWVVEIVVPASDSSDPYYTAGGDAWVKVDGTKQKLRGARLTEFIKQRLEKGTGASHKIDVAKQRLIAADVISELEDNFRIATAFTSGLPGNAVYLLPSTGVWKQYRNQLSFLGHRMLQELRETYERIERWHGIVASGINPGIGNLEIPEITNFLRIRLPDLITRFKNAVKI